MSRLYLETSAAAKLVSNEAESDGLRRYLIHSTSDQPAVSSALLETELRRMAARTLIAQTSVTAVLNRVRLLETTRGLFHEAGLLPGTHLRSLDALHVATALYAEVDEIISYDIRLKEAAMAVGLTVTSPS